MGAGLPNQCVCLTDHALFNVQHVATVKLLDTGYPAVGDIGVAVHQQSLAVGGYHLAVVLKGPSVHGLVKGGIAQVVVILGQLVTEVAVPGGEHRLEHLYLDINALSCPAQPEVTDGIQIGQ